MFSNEECADEIGDATSLITLNGSTLNSIPQVHKLAEEQVNARADSNDCTGDTALNTSVSESLRDAAEQRDASWRPAAPESDVANDFLDEAVRPLFVQHRGELIPHLPSAGRMSVPEWEKIHGEKRGRNTIDPRTVIYPLIAGRLHRGPFSHTGSCDFYPPLNAAEVLDGVGVAAPTELQLQLCKEALDDLLGPSKKLEGHPRWQVYFRCDDTQLSAELARSYPLPDEWEARPFLLSASVDSSRERQRSAGLIDRKGKRVRPRRTTNASSKQVN